MDFCGENRFARSTPALHNGYVMGLVTESYFFFVIYKTQTPFCMKAQFYKADGGRQN